MKKYFNTIICVVLVLCMIPLIVSAASGDRNSTGDVVASTTTIPTGAGIINAGDLDDNVQSAEQKFDASTGGFNYNVLSDNTAEIIGYTGSEKILTIPAKLDDHEVSSLAPDSFLNKTELVRVTIPDGIKKIDERAFYLCSSLVTVTIGNTVTEIGNNAFRGCSSLSSIMLPSALKTIGVNAFYDCTALVNLIIPESVTSVGQRALYNTGWLDAQPDGLVYAGSVAYKFKGEAAADSALSILDSTASISSEAFYSQTKITAVRIPAACKTVNYAAFSYCSGLTSVVIESGVTSLGSYAFYKCSSLESVTIPPSVKEIEEKAFDEIKGLTIMGISDSAAEKYAKANSITFKALSEIPEDNTGEGGIIYGDNNSDKFVNAKDVLLLKQYLARWSVTPDLKAADVNLDEAVNAKDALLLRKYLAGYPVTLGKKQ